MLYLGIEGRYDHLPHHTIYIARDHERNPDEIDRLKILPEDPSFYVQNAGVTDDSLAPRGMSTLLRPGAGSAPEPHDRLAVAEGRVPEARPAAARQGRSQRRGGPDPVREDAHPSMTGRTRYQVYSRSDVQPRTTSGQMLLRRPGNRYQDLEQVYLVGGGTHPGSGLPVIYESARISARLMCDELGLAFPEVPSLPGRIPAEPYRRSGGRPDAATPPRHGDRAPAFERLSGAVCA